MTAGRPRGARGSRGPGRTEGARPPRQRPPAANARDVALAALERVDGGAYANLALPPMLRRSTPDPVGAGGRHRPGLRVAAHAGGARLRPGPAVAPAPGAAGAAGPAGAAPRRLRAAVRGHGRPRRRGRDRRGGGQGRPPRPGRLRQRRAPPPGRDPAGLARPGARPGRLGHHPRLPPGLDRRGGAGPPGPARSWSPWSRRTTPGPRSACGSPPAGPPATSCWPSWPRPA